MQAPYYFSNDELDQLQIVGISGKAGSGKSTIGRYLIQTHGFMPEPFARHLKASAVAFEGLPVREVCGSYKSPYVRDRLEKAGTEEGRDVHGQDVWLRTTEAHMFMDFDAGVKRFVFTDVRFFNEVDFIHALGGKVYRLEGRGDTLNTHRSNIELDNYDGFDGHISNRPGNEAAMFAVLQSRLGLTRMQGAA